jgi:hypothetical protein
MPSVCTELAGFHFCAQAIFNMVGKNNFLNENVLDGKYPKPPPPPFLHFTIGNCYQAKVNPLGKPGLTEHA